MDGIPQDNFDGEQTLSPTFSDDCIEFITEVKCTMNELLQEEGKIVHKTTYYRVLNLRSFEVSLLYDRLLGIIHELGQS